jgi:hypothetical protein
VSVYIILFFLGFMLAIGLLAYASIQVAKLNEKAKDFSKNLKERYSKPLTDLDDSAKKSAENNAENNTENKTAEPKGESPK